MAEQELNPEDPPCLHLLSAFLAMEPTDSLIALARICGQGSVTERVQRFIWSHCITEALGSVVLSTRNGKFHSPYLKNFLKKLISEAEQSSWPVIDEIYERYAHYMASMKDDFVGNEVTRVNKCISFLFPDDCIELSSCPKSRKLVIPLQCSLNMLEGDTGCSVWPSSLYLSEFILSFPELFSNKSCFEVGSGVGLVGICLDHVRASEVSLSDGDVSTLANMKLNLELNDMSVETEIPKTNEDPEKVKCIYLQWETAAEDRLQSFKPDIILGADVIYDPLCLPHLVRVLGALLNQTTSDHDKPNKSVIDGNFNGAKPEDNDDNRCGFDTLLCRSEGNVNPNKGSKKGPLALIASVIRNVDTFNCFLELIDKTSLTITDLTETLKPINLLPYMQSYNRSNIRLFMVSYK